MRHRGSLGLVLVACLLTGCVERRFLVATDQPGAQVYVNGKSYGAAPVDVPFEYYGKYDITIVKDGFETIREQRRISPPWYAYPPFDFMVENMYPFTVRDRRVIDDFRMQPLPQPNVQELLLQGDALRARGRQLPDPGVPPLRDRPVQAAVPPAGNLPPDQRLVPPIVVQPENPALQGVPTRPPGTPVPSPATDPRLPGGPQLLPPQVVPQPDTPAPGSPLPPATNPPLNGVPG
ncbi:PEGA domain-containing protein [Tuwongella immobilis]|nr:PEGA domain-containing protein [Tuwongella immobilis]